MGELINGRTPEHIKRILAWRSVNCAELECDKCPNEDICSPANGNEEAMARDALALVERLESERDAALAKVPRWISVEERLPEHEHEVLVYTDRYGGLTEFAYYVRHLEVWYQNCCLLIPNVTHWMPLQSVPEGE